MTYKKPNERIISTKCKNNKPTILGLDCSTATIGWGLVSISKKPRLLKYGHLKPMPSKNGSLIKRLNDTYDRINHLCQELSPNIVAIEQIKKFMKGLSSAQTITILAGFNRVVSVSAYKVSNDLRYYDELEIRRIIKHHYKIDRVSKDNMPDIIRLYLEKSFAGPLNKKNEPAIETNDEADGIAVAWACCLNLMEVKNESLSNIRSE